MLSWKIDLDVLEVQRPSDFESAFTAAQQRGIGAMLILSSPLIPANLQTLFGLSGAAGGYIGGVGVPKGCVVRC
jgi:hypothetical protein